ncbi:hypothetical protein B6U93_03060 [Candidatus Woesearchaeota archaeon ex4484_78]|nr:MAG: hypothetical protein B6U93_03060 [Candidatus Woesearchaeota archaeon ex4484_78]
MFLRIVGLLYLMAKRFVTFFEQDLSLEGRLRSFFDIYSWERSGTISDPEINKMSIPCVIPSKFRKHSDDSVTKLKEAVDLYIDGVRKKYSKKVSYLEAEISKKRRRTKARKQLEEKRDLIQSFLENIDELIYLKGPFGSSKYPVYHLITPPLNKEDREPLKDFFVIDCSVASQTALTLNFPFSLVGKNKKIPLNALLNAKAVAKDYETHNWHPVRVQEELFDKPEDVVKQRFLNLVSAFGVGFEENDLEFMNKRDFIRAIEQILNDNKGEKLTVSAIVNLKENYLITTLDCGESEIPVVVPGQNKAVDVKIIRVKDQFELIEKDNELIERIQPLFIYGHNHLKFDYGKAEELTRSFAPGVGRKKVKFVSSVGGEAGDRFVVHRVVPGRLDIDASGYAQHFMFTYNNKLDVVFEHLTGTRSKKTMTHDELAFYTTRAENGDKKAAKDILFYAAQDAMKSFLIGERLKLEHVLLSYVFSSLPSRIDTVSKETLSEEYWVKWYFKKKHTFPVIKPSRQKISNAFSYDDFNIVSYFISELSQRTKSSLSPVKGLRDGYLVAFFPFASAFKKLLQRDPDVKALYDRVNETSNVKEKTRLLKALEELAKYPLFKTFNSGFESFEQLEKRFAAEFKLGWSGNEIKEYTQRVNSALSGISSIVEKYSCVNFNKEFFVLPLDAEKDLKKLSAYNLCVVLGEGRFLSGVRGKFAGKVNDEFVMFGIADFNSSKGERCDFEKQFYKVFFNEIIMNNNPKGALEYVVETAKQFAQYKVPDEDLVFSREAKKDYFDFNIRANQAFVKQLKSKKAMKGDLVKYKKSIEELKFKFFGLQKNNEKTLFSEENYNFCPEKGTISSVVNWIFGFSRSDSGYAVLKNVFEGKGSEEDVDYLLEIYDNQR